MHVRFVFGLLIIGLLAGCGGGKKKNVTEEPVSVEDFLRPFPPVRLPYVLNDSILLKKMPDSIKLSLKAWKSVIPDSVYIKYFSDRPGLRVYPLGKVADASKGKYVILKGVSGEDRIGYLFYFDKKNRYKGAMEFAAVAGDAHVHSYGRMDSRFDISLVTEIHKPGGSTVVKENTFGLSDDGSFTLIMTNSNEAVNNRKLYNPVDSLPRRFKWSGDYVAGKNNIVSLRDGVVPREYRFFIHFVNEDASCKGELKGVAEMSGEGKAKFTERGGPCGIEFRMTDNHVTIREVGGCGAYRDVSCFFEGTYVKKKVQKIKKKVKGNN